MESGLCLERVSLRRCALNQVTPLSVCQVRTGRRVLDVRILRVEALTDHDRITDPRDESSVDDLDRNRLHVGATESASMARHHGDPLFVLCLYVRRQAGRHSLSPRQMGDVDGMRHVARRVQCDLRQVLVAEPWLSRRDGAGLVCDLLGAGSAAHGVLLVVEGSRENTVSVPLVDSDDRTVSDHCGLYVLFCVEIRRSDDLACVAVATRFGCGRVFRGKSPIWRSELEAESDLHGDYVGRSLAPKFRTFVNQRDSAGTFAKHPCSYSSARSLGMVGATD